MANEVTDALRAFDAEDSIGCMVLAGGERAFCAGADLKWIANQEFETACLHNLAVYMDQVAASPSSMPANRRMVSLS